MRQTAERGLLVHYRGERKTSALRLKFDPDADAARPNNRPTYSFQTGGIAYDGISAYGRWEDECDWPAQPA